MSLKRKLGTIRLRCEAMQLEYEEESKGPEDEESTGHERWVGEAAAESHMLNMKDVRGGV